MINNLPLFYKELIPLNSNLHSDWRTQTTDKASWLSGQHAVPVLTEEFNKAHRFFPIIFSATDKPVPLALMGMNEGVNVFVDSDGGVDRVRYIPAYVRRYPFLLARLSSEGDDLSLCLDPSSGLVGPSVDGEALFLNDEPSERCRAILSFCEQFEIAAQKTSLFVDLLIEHDLLVDGELTIQRAGGEPSIYRGFRMVGDEKLQSLNGSSLKKLQNNGVLKLIHLHQSSLSITSELFDEASLAAL